MSNAIVTLALSDRYQPLLGRMLSALHTVRDPTPVVAWCNAWPAGSPDRSLPCGAYCAKPFAMRAAAEMGYRTLLWVDAACYPIQHLGVLFEHVRTHGYYAQDNGWSVGQWCSDKALGTLGITREQAHEIPEISTMAMGLDLWHASSESFLNDWCRLAADGVTFPGAHTNDTKEAKERFGRRVGHVSDDPRVLGHRHDQTAASVLAWRRGWHRTPRPTFADYRKNPQDPSTLLVNHGGM